MVGKEDGVVCVRRRGAPSRKTPFSATRFTPAPPTIYCVICCANNLYLAGPSPCPCPGVDTLLGWCSLPPLTQTNREQGKRPLFYTFIGQKRRNLCRIAGFTLLLTQNISRPDTKPPFRRDPGERGHGLGVMERKTWKTLYVVPGVFHVFAYRVAFMCQTELDLRGDYQTESKRAGTRRS